MTLPTPRFRSTLELRLKRLSAVMSLMTNGEEWEKVLFDAWSQTPFGCDVINDAAAEALKRAETEAASQTPFGCDVINDFEFSPELKTALAGLKRLSAVMSLMTARRRYRGAPIGDRLKRLSAVMSLMTGRLQGGAIAANVMGLKRLSAVMSLMTPRQTRRTGKSRILCLKRLSAVMSLMTRHRTKSGRAWLHGSQTPFGCDVINDCTMFWSAPAKGFFALVGG